MEKRNKDYTKSIDKKIKSVIKPKAGMVKLEIKETLNNEQLNVQKIVDNKDYTFVIGDASSGKTFTAVYIALTKLKDKECSEIWISRPMLKNNLAALPGDIKEKMYPYTFPIIQNIELLIGKENCEKLLDKDIIRIMPVEVAKGATFTDAFVILDEFQDCKYGDLRTMMTRLGVRSKMVLCGSMEQIDERIGNESSIYIAEKLKNNKDVGYIELKSNHRSKTLTTLLPEMDKIYKNIKNKSDNKEILND